MITHLGGMNNSKMKMELFFYSNKPNIKEILCISSKPNRRSLLSQAVMFIYVSSVSITYFVYQFKNKLKNQPVFHVNYIHFMYESESVALSCKFIWFLSK